MAKTAMKVVDNVAIFKVSGTGTETISLDTDLLLPTQEILPAAVLKVGIAHMQWTCGTSISVTRGGVEVAELFTNTGNMDFAGVGGFCDYTESAEDLVVEIVGGGVIYITLRKAGGYTSRVEPEFFGQYDDPTKVGE